MRPIEFVARVADLGGVSIEDAERNARGDVRCPDRRRERGRDERRQRNSSVTSSPSCWDGPNGSRRAAPAANDHGLLEAVVGVAGSVVHAGTALVRRPIDAGMRAAGLKH